MVVVLSPSSAHMVVPSPSCVSARWVGTNVGWGYSPWHPKLHNDDERRMSLVVRRLVATSLTATWHLDAMLERSVVGASELAQLVSLLYVVHRVAPWLFVRRWLPCRRCLLLVSEIERGRESHCSPGGCPSSWSFIRHRRKSSSIVCRWLQRRLLLMRKKRWGRGGSLTWMNVNDDDDLRRHRLDMARPLMCHVVFDTRHRNGDVRWRCDVVIVVGMCRGSWGRLNDGRGWSIIVLSARWVRTNVGWGTDRGVPKYTMTTNDECHSSFVIWLPRRPQRRGTWMPCYRRQWWGHVSLLTSAPYRCTSFVVCRFRRSSGCRWFPATRPLPLV